MEKNKMSIIKKGETLFGLFYTLDKKNKYSDNQKTLK